MNSERNSIVTTRQAARDHQKVRVPTFGQLVVLYLNSGRAFSESMVAPRSTIFLSFTWSELKGTTTYFVPIPRKPPTDSTAKGTFSAGVTIRSSIVPTVSLASFTTVLPTTLDVRYPVASDAGSTFIRVTVCGAPCAKAGPLSDAARRAAPARDVIECIICSSFRSFDDGARNRSEAGCILSGALPRRDYFFCASFNPPRAFWLGVTECLADDFLMAPLAEPAMRSDAISRPYRGTPSIDNSRGRVVWSAAAQLAIDAARPMGEE